MIKALLLIFEPIPAWDRIALARRSVGFLVFIYLIPMFLIGSVSEGYGLVHWGKPRGEVHHVVPLTIPEVVVYEVLEILLWLVVVFIGGKMVKSLGDTFHGQHSFTQAFTVCAYGLGPMFALRVFDMVPGMSLWVTWTIGVVLMFSILYHGVPRVMNPDPPHAFGLYLTTGILLATTSALARFLMTMFIQGKFVKLDQLISKFGGGHM